ncbi:hypothetical protein BU24DRAFT_363190 [Aaosphaeria arxii CBS 175.79]|uniref:RRM domain-containing protein n=1 Tax=Aaosphaeria arxii CBS 175.79 TaxID=1450172 RepID=A0A6A5YA86_9PLEO|nr:uncharacterized protein BU24DRAFT_363190 [Aaosphaeria arxii CBS 175.79]KAF2022133.1 hypothetical protein BU24DRAFT_363190 [Aaosphaeria arxii CBS 175.79]
MSPPGTGSENYMVIASGLINNAPFLADWQQFKDFLRRIVEYQPGWTEVLQGPRKGEKQGWCRIDRRDDAETAYEEFASKRGILVHLFKTSRTNEEYRMLKCNCWPHFPDMSEHGHSPHRSGINVGGVNQYVASVRGAATPRCVAPTASMYTFPTYSQAPLYNTYSTHANYPVHTVAAPMGAQHMPMYSATASGIPVNVRHGAMITEARGIFLSNLNYSVKPSDLNTLLQTVGRPVESKLHRDTRTGTFRGNATAKFTTKEEAMFAVAHLNNREHMGMNIKVRLDTDATVVAQVQAPVIVNGSVSGA